MRVVEPVGAEGRVSETREAEPVVTLFSVVQVTEATWRGT